MTHLSKEAAASVMARIDPNYVPPQQSIPGSDLGAGTPAARFFWLMAEPAVDIQPPRKHWWQTLIGG